MTAEQKLDAMELDIVYLIRNSSYKNIYLFLTAVRTFIFIYIVEYKAWEYGFCGIHNFLNVVNGLLIIMRYIQSYYCRRKTFRKCAVDD